MKLTKLLIFHTRLSWKHTLMNSNIKLWAHKNSYKENRAYQGLR